MKDISAVVIFCEDVRREGAGKDTIIGAMADFLRVPGFPGKIRRLAIYARLRFSIDGVFDAPITLSVETKGIEGADNQDSLVPPEIIEAAVSSGKRFGAPYATINAKIEIRCPLTISKPTSIQVMLKVDGEQELCGFLQIIEKEAPTNQLFKQAMPRRQKTKP